MQLQASLNANFETNIRSLKFACPAIVIGVEDIQDGLITVQPVVNRFFPDMSYDTEAHIIEVPIIFPSTMNTSITFPVNIGDGVLLIFCHNDIDNYKYGLKEPHDPQTSAYLASQSAVAIVGFNPYQESALNPNNYSNQLNMDDVNIVHNKNTENEVTFSLTQDGKVVCNAPNGVSLKTTVAEVEAEKVTTNALVETSNDVVVKGLSVYKHMTTHTHSYTDDGQPMNTGVPNN